MLLSYQLWSDQPQLTSVCLKGLRSKAVLCWRQMPITAFRASGSGVGSGARSGVCAQQRCLMLCMRDVGNWPSPIECCSAPGWVPLLVFWSERAAEDVSGAHRAALRQ